MADITKCEGIKCPLKDSCYSSTAPLNEFRQSMFKDVPYNHETEECIHYWDNSESIQKSEILNDLANGDN